MPPALAAQRTRVREFFALDDDWARPVPPIGRADWAFVAGMWVFGLVTLELVRGVGVLAQIEQPWWVQWIAVTTGAFALLWRRRYPVGVGLFLAAHMFVVGVTMPAVMGQLSLQVCYFMGLFSLVAWARRRTTAVAAAVIIIGLMLLWVAWQFAVGSGVQEFLDDTSDYERQGVVPPVIAAVAMTFVINILYFVGALVGGQVAWRSARQRTRLEEQSSTIAAQADSLRRRAVVDERLRIARELHDVVGHHVSVIGIQAGAARRVLDKRPEEAAGALSRIEDSSRNAVAQMRGLLGTLRDIEGIAHPGLGTSHGVSATADDPGVARRPEPGLADLRALVTERDSGGLRTAYRLVEGSEGAQHHVPAPIGLTLYRVAQEALANVTRHSTATTADVVARIEPGIRGYAEVEVIDNGRPRHGTSGSGLGQLGMRERAALHRGTVEMGPRPLGGYRVRVRIPLGDSDV